jgi:hypothetical protein
MPLHFSPYGTSGVDMYKTASAEDGHANPPGRMVLQNEIWEKVKAVCELI